jgi:hypothetical protein
MKKKGILYIQHITIILIITFISISYSIPFFSDLSADMGAYYLGAGLISEDFILYQDWFDHKGPIIYGFLKLINLTIGDGVYAIYFSISLILIIFLCTVLYILSKNNLTLFEKILFLVFASSIFYIQDFNFCINLIQYIFLFLAFQLYIKQKIILSIFFITLSILTRIDSFIYLFPIIFHFFFIQKNNIYETIKLILTFIIIFFITLSIFSFVLNFGLHDYFLTNFIWNFNTYQKLDFITGYKIFILSFLNDINFTVKYHLLYIYTLLLVYYFVYKKIYLSLNKDEFLFLILICVSGFILFLISKSIKNYHIMNLYLPLYFSIIYLIDKKKKILKNLIFLLISLCLFIKPIYFLSENIKSNCIDYKKNCENIISQNYDLIKYLNSKKKNSVNLIFDEPYFYIESSSTPNLGHGNFIVFRDNNLYNKIHTTIEQNFFNLKINDEIILPNNYKLKINKKYLNVLHNQNLILVKHFENYSLFRLINNFKIE